MKTGLKWVFLSLLLLAVSACKNPLSGGKGGSALDPNFRPGMPQGKFGDHLILVSGDNQTANILTNISFVVKVVDLSGNVVPDINLTLTPGAGSGSASPVTTNAQGLATVTWTLGDLIGVQSITVSGKDFTGSPSSLTLSATAVGGAAKSGKQIGLGGGISSSTTMKMRVEIGSPRVGGPATSSTIKLYPGIHGDQKANK